jgi:MurNAc alpha-1-phosphate uridylyltransferase
MELCRRPWRADATTARYPAHAMAAAGGQSLIAWQLQALAAAGCEDVVINTSWLAQQMPRALGDGSRWGLRIVYSYEGPTALETGGGMLAALPLLGDKPFLLVNGDIWTDFDFRQIAPLEDALARLVMVDAAQHAPRGDFVLEASGRLGLHGRPQLTYAGIGLFHPDILRDWSRLLNRKQDNRLAPARFGLADVLRARIDRGQVLGQHFTGQWTDVGTPERLEALRSRLAIAAR